MTDGLMLLCTVHPLQPMNFDLVSSRQNIQSTVWQNMRFKPPPPNSPIGWRIEFRPLEVGVHSSVGGRSHGSVGGNVQTVGGRSPW